MKTARSIRSALWLVLLAWPLAPFALGVMWGMAGGGGRRDGLKPRTGGTSAGPCRGSAAVRANGWRLLRSLAGSGAALGALLLATPALAAPPAPPGPLAALAHQAAVEAAEQRGDPLEDLLRAVLAEELALDEPVEAEDEPAVEAEEAELDPAEEPADGEERQAFGAMLAGNIVAAGWCAVYRDKPKEGAPGCDAGVGGAFWRSRRGRLFLAGVVGQETAGFGFGATAYRSPDGRVVVAGAVGVVAPYDGRGIDAGRAALAIGATFGIGGR